MADWHRHGDERPLDREIVWLKTAVAATWPARYVTRRDGRHYWTYSGSRICHEASWDHLWCCMSDPPPLTDDHGAEA